MFVEKGSSSVNKKGGTSFQRRWKKKVVREALLHITWQKHEFCG